MPRPDGFLRIYTVLLLCAVTVTGSSAQTFKKIADFQGFDGGSPDFMTMVQGVDGNFYGTSLQGGTGGHAQGDVFTMTSSGTLTNIYTFCVLPNCPDGMQPATSLLLGVDGNFYGTTQRGGDINCNPSDGCGTVFQITPKGTLTTLHVFEGSDGEIPRGRIAQGRDGNLYGTTYLGGAKGQGTIFRVGTDGSGFAVLHSFCQEPGCADGYQPQAGLIAATDGNFYGTTPFGGDPRCAKPNGCGTIFRMTPSGTLSTLHAFHNGHAAVPFSELTQAADGNLYGTTFYGGKLSCFGGVGCGVLFRVTSGHFSVLHKFAGQPTEGAAPYAPLFQGTDGNFYGTTYYGGSSADYGTLFEVTPDGALQTMADFCSEGGDCTDTGSHPTSGLLQATNGLFYGTVPSGGKNGVGIVYTLDMGLGPFVTLLPDSGSVGGKAGILGQGLTGTTDVSINGTPAKFSVVSDTFLKATIPNGATSGYVTVTTPSGTLISNKVFQVLP